MKYLIPSLQDDQKAADDLRQLRWPNGVTCPRCGGDAVESRDRCDNGLQRFNCVPCGAWCNAVPRSTRTRQPRPFLWKCERTCAPRPSNPSLPPRCKPGRSSSLMYTTSTTLPRLTMTIGRSTMVRARMHVVPRTVAV